MRSARGIRVALATMPGSIPRGHLPGLGDGDDPLGDASGRNLVKRAAAVVTLGAGFGDAAKAIRRINPAAVVGFGGYPTVPPVLAASSCGCRRSCTSRTR